MKFKFQKVFTLSVFLFVTAVAVAQTPANDLCLNAETLVCNSQLTATTVGATDSDTPTSCGFFADDLGVWYKFTGTGGEMMLTTCGQLTGSTGSLSYMALFSGSDCSNLTCLGNAGDFPAGLNCSFTSSTTMAFPTTLGTTYFVFITANSGNPATIDYNLQLTCNPVTGVSEERIYDFNVYPNPSAGTFLLEVVVEEIGTQIVLSDLSGRVVYSESVLEIGKVRKQLDLNVSEGVYLMSIKSNKGLITRRIQIL